MREKGQTEAAKTLETPVVSRGIEILTEKLRFITVPGIRAIIAPAAVMTTFITFKQFDIVYLLTQQKGYMTGANLNTVITYAYQNAFVSNNYGLSSAVSMLLFVLIILFSLATNRSLREE